LNRRNNARFKLLAFFTLGVALIAVWHLVSSLGAIVGGIGWFFSVIVPFIYGFVIAYLLNIPCSALQRLLDKSKVKFLRRFKRGISVTLIYLIFLVLISMTLWMFLPRLFFSIVELVSHLPDHIQRLETFITNLNESGQLPFHLDLSQLFTSIDNADPMELITNFFSYDRLASYVSTIFSGAAILFRWILAFISSIYFLFGMDKLSRFAKRLLNALLSEKVSKIVLSYGRKTNQYFKKYIFCLIMDCLFMAVAGTIVLTILGSPYAIVLGLLLGVMNFIPYFGSIFATIVAIIVVWATQGFTMGVISTALLLVIQQLDANLVQPRLYGSGLKLNPLLVIISVTVGGAIGGVVGGAIGGTVVGMIIAIPIAKVLMNILEDIMAYREQKKLPVSTESAESAEAEDADREA